MDLKNEIFERIFSHRKMQGFSVEEQSIIASIFEEVLIDIRKEIPDGTVSELFHEY